MFSLCALTFLFFAAVFTLAHFFLYGWQYMRLNCSEVQPQTIEGICALQYEILLDVITNTSASAWWAVCCGMRMSAEMSDIKNSLLSVSRQLPNESMSWFLTFFVTCACIYDCIWDQTTPIRRASVWPSTSFQHCKLLHIVIASSKSKLVSEDFHNETERNFSGFKSFGGETLKPLKKM